MGELRKCPKCKKYRLWYVEYSNEWICYNCDFKRKGERQPRTLGGKEE